jgi:hypothetical protein
MLPKEYTRRKKWGDFIYEKRYFKLTRIRQVRDSRFAPQYPKSPIRKIIIPNRMKKQAIISIDDNGKLVKLNKWIILCTSGRKRK